VKGRIALVVTALTGVALVAAPVSGGAAAKTKKVGVEDNFYSPTKVTVNLGTTIDWEWPEGGGDVHDVKLTSGPKGVKKFQSDAGSSGYSYKKKLTRPGTYKILCTFHEDDGMRMTITVRKKK
jgi:plastocyanin